MKLCSEIQDTLSLTSILHLDRVMKLIYKIFFLSILYYKENFPMSDFIIADNRIQPTAVLDARGLSCPMPLFQTKKEITNLTSGEILQIDGTDPGSRKDFSGWCDRSGNKYLGEREMHGYISFFIKKG